MFVIGTFARLGGVSVRTLRYYDEIGLLRPAWVDGSSGYRWYAPEQLHRLHRIVALQDLGLPLIDIGRLLDADPSIEELRGILLLRRAEAHDRLAAAAERLARVEARLVQMEGTPMSDFDVVVKSTDAYWVVALTEQVSGVDQIVATHERLWPRLHAILDGLGVAFVPPSIAVERGEAPIEFTAALPFPEGMACDTDGASTFELAGLPRVAATVLHGEPDFHAGFAALQAWIAEAGEKESGELREIYLDCDGPRDTWVVELQLALEPRGQ